MVASDKPKMGKEDRLLRPDQVAKKLECSKREAYNLIAEGYFICFYPNGPGRRPVRVWESSVIAYIEAFSVKQ